MTVPSQPGDGPPGSDVSHEDVPTRREPSAEEFLEMQNSPEFVQLRSNFRRFAFPLTAFFLIWYFVYVLLSTYAVEFMSTKVVGNVNIGFILGLLQFVTTFVLTALYIRHANKNLDPLSTKLRNRMEGQN